MFMHAAWRESMNRGRKLTITSIKKLSMISGR